MKKCLAACKKPFNEMTLQTSPPRYLLDYDAANSHSIHSFSIIKHTGGISSSKTGAIVTRSIFSPGSSKPFHFLGPSAANYTFTAEQWKFTSACLNLLVCSPTCHIVVRLVLQALSEGTGSLCQTVAWLTLVISLRLGCIHLTSFGKTSMHYS